MLYVRENKVCLSYGIHLEKVNLFILEQIRIIEFCPFDHYHALNQEVFFTNDARIHVIAYGKRSPPPPQKKKTKKNYTPGKAVRWLRLNLMYL